MQTTGRERPEKAGDAGNNNTGGVKLLDHHNNSGQMVSIYGGSQTVLIDDTTTPGTTYVGTAAPGSDTVAGKADDRWKIMASDDTGVRWAYTTLDPGVEGTGPDYAGRPDQIWDDRAALPYA